MSNHVKEFLQINKKKIDHPVEKKNEKKTRSVTASQ
jgi:hypothetical protein